MKKIISSGVGVLLLITPFAASAVTVGELQAQIQQLLATIAQLQGGAQASSATSCINLSYNMGPDDRDADTNGEVSKLQRFLAQNPAIYPEGRITGYFGPATMRAVQRWQKTHGLVSSGDPDSTGYGFVGSRTRTAMRCQNTVSYAASNVRFVAGPTSGTIPLYVKFSANLPTIGTSGGTIYVVPGDGQSNYTVCTVPAGSTAPCGAWEGTLIYKTPGTYTARLEQSSGGTSVLLGTATITVYANDDVTMRDSRRISDIRQLQLAMELYYDTYLRYPMELSPLVTNNFISRIPNDPLTGAAYAYAPLGTSCEGYHLGARLENPSQSALSADADAQPGATCGGASDFSGVDPIYDVREYPQSFYPAASPWIKVTYPNGGEQLVFGLEKDIDFRITWISYNLVGNVYAYLWFPDGRMCYLGTAPVTNGTIGFKMGSNHQCEKIPSKITSGQYKVVLGADGNVPNSDHGPKDESDNWFTVINTPLITSTTAKAAGNFEADAGGELSIYGSDLATVDSTRVYVGNIEAHVTWTSDTRVDIRVPTSLMPGQRYDLTITNRYGTSNPVSIKILSAVGTEVGYPSLNLVSPAGGAYVMAGQPIYIAWQTTNAHAGATARVSYASCDYNCPKTVVASGLPATGAYEALTLPIGNWYIYVELLPAINGFTPGAASLLHVI